VLSQIPNAAILNQPAVGNRKLPIYKLLRGGQDKPCSLENKQLLIIAHQITTYRKSLNRLPLI
jgi:hypothetical protein